MLLLVVAAVAAPWLNIPRDQADSAGMLAHLHAFFVGADLLYDDEYAAVGMSPLFAFVTGEGVVSNHWPVGATWLQAPGYLLGVGLAKVLAALGVGGGDPMGVAALLGVRAWAIVVLAVASWGLYRWAGGGRAAAVLCAVAVIGTPLWYYASESPLRPHLWGACVVGVLVWLWQRADLGDDTWRPVALGALAGLASCIRPQLAPLVLLAWHDAWGRSPRWRGMALATAAFIPWPLLFLRMQIWMYGADVGDYRGEVTHHLGHFLFSSHHGVATWCPVLVLGLGAMVVAVRGRERGAWLLLAIMGLQLWVDSGMRAITPTSVLGTRTWSGGVAFGPRKLVDVLPLMVPAALVAIERARTSGRLRVLGAVAGLACVPTVLLHGAAFIDPDRTTGDVHTLGSLLSTMGLGLSPARWWGAIDGRMLPPLVGAVGLVVVVVPSIGLIAGVAHVVRRRSVQGRVVLVAAVGVALAVVANVWLAVLMVRSDAAMARDPGRMRRAAERMLPAHVATVAATGRHHALLRERLGPSAAP